MERIFLEYFIVGLHVSGSKPLTALIPFSGISLRWTRICPLHVHASTLSRELEGCKWQVEIALDITKGVLEAARWTRHDRCCHASRRIKYGVVSVHTLSDSRRSKRDSSRVIGIRYD